MVTRLVVATLVTLSLAAASCGPSVNQVCDDYALAWCTAQFNCAPTQAQATYGTVAKCTIVRESPGIGNCNGAQSSCATGTSYDTGAAEQCVSDTNKIGTDAGQCSNSMGCLTCADLMNNAQPPSCAPNLICH
jgi:hypothetical protein